MTTRTQWVRNVADSHRNISRLQRLSFRCPMKVSQDGPPGVLFRSVVTGENPSNHVFVDGDGESQGNLLSDARTAPGGIKLLHLDDGINEFSTGSSGPGPPPLLGREEVAILSVPQGLVEAQASRRFQNDGGTDQAGRRHQQSAPTGDEAVRKAEMGSALARAIED